MFHKVAGKRSAAEALDAAEHSSEAKMYIIKILTDQEGEYQSVAEEENPVEMPFDCTECPSEGADDGQERIDEQMCIENDSLSIEESPLMLEPRSEVKVKKQHFSGWIANRHKLKFLDKWYKEFPFIDYDKESNLMFCKACRKYVNDWRKNSPFVVGTDNFRASMLRYHQRSSMHAECQELADALAAQDSEAMQKDLYKDQLSHVFKSVYFIYKNKMPYTHFPQLCESQKREGTDFTVYTTHIKVVPLFGKFIGMAFEKELAHKIAHVSEFTLIIDASFRRNIESHDLVYIKYIEGMIIQTAFLGVIDSSAKLHDSMYNILSTLFKKYGIEKWVDKVVYIMTDKSDNHVWLEGLIDLVGTMSSQNFVSEIKYLAHKVRFCADVVQNHKTTSTFDALLWSIYCYYERVDSCKRNLMHMNKELDDIIECYGGLPKNSYTTLYYEALKAVEEDWQLLVPLLEAEQQLLHFDFKIRKSGARILSVITRTSFICKMAVLLDIFSCISDFAVKLGSDGLLPYDVHILLDEVCTGIEKAVSGEGSNVAAIGEELNAMPGYFRYIEIKDDSSMHHILPELNKFGHDVISYLKSLIDNSFLEKCFIFNVSLWPEDEELEAFGNSEFSCIFLALKGKEKHLECAMAEWCMFKKTVSTLFPFEVKQDSKSVITKMVFDYENKYPFVTSVLKKILLLDFECGEIKRGYHEMCLNKSCSRSMLSLQSLQTMMMISIYGPSLGEFDFSLALDLFLNSRHRKFRKKIIDKKLTLSYVSDHEDDSLE